MNVSAHLRCPVWGGRDAAVEVPCLEVEAGVVPGAAVAQLVAGGGQVPAHVAALWKHYCGGQFAEETIY